MSQGGAAGEYRIETDPAKLWGYGLSIDDVATAVTGANVLAASGRIEDQGKLLLVLTDSRLTDPRADRERRGQDRQRRGGARARCGPGEGRAERRSGSG